MTANTVSKILQNTGDLKNQQLIEQAKKIKLESSGLDLASVIQDNKNRIRLCNEKYRSQGKGYESLRFPMFTEKLEGLESKGIYGFAGESNSGKTALMTNLFVDLVENEENHLYGIYFSLDDAEESIYARIASMKMTSIKEDTGSVDDQGAPIFRRKEAPISVFSKPAIYESAIEEDSDPDKTALYIRYLELREEGMDFLEKIVERITFIDASSEYAMNQKTMYDFIKKMKAEIVKQDPLANILVAIDAFDDICLDHATDQETAEKSKLLKKWSLDLEIPIFFSKHLKKLGTNRRPVLDDLKDSNRLAYDASVIFLVFNDVSKNKTAAKVYDVCATDSSVKLPVIEIDWAKNKKSGYKGYTFTHFRPDNSYAEEVPAEHMNYYIRLLNS